MATGAEFVDFNAKRLLGRDDFATRFLDYMKGNFGDLSRSVYRKDGVFDAALGLSGDGAGKFKIDGTSEANDANGHTLDIAASGYASGVAFENTNAIAYNVALHYAEKPSGVQINPRTGLPEFQKMVEVIGERAEPDLVTVAGAGLNLRVNSVTEAGVSNAGRIVAVWKKTPGRDASTEAVAIELCTVQYSGGNNFVLTTGQFGQTAASTTPSDYFVLLLGPTVKRNASLNGTGEHCFIGTVTGAGAGNPPVTFDVSGQREISATITALSEVIRNDSHGFAKIRVKADASDVDEKQIEVQDALGVPKFYVDEDGDVTIAGNLFVTGTTTQNNVVQVNSNETVTGNLTAGDSVTDSHVIKGNWRHTNPAGSANYFHVDGITGKVGVGQLADAAYPLAITGGAKLTTGNLWLLSGGITVDSGNIVANAGFVSASGNISTTSGDVVVGSNGFSLDDFSATQAIINFAAGDWIEYDRTTNEYKFNIASTTEFSINSNGVVAQNGIRVGASASTTAGVIRWDGSNFQGYDGGGWVNLDTQGQPPGGATTNVQFNNAGIFDGDSTFTWDDTNKRLTVGEITFGAPNSFDDVFRISRTYGALSYVGSMGVFIDLDYSNAASGYGPSGFVVNPRTTNTAGAFGTLTGIRSHVEATGIGGTTSAIRGIDVQCDVGGGHTLNGPLYGIYIQDGASGGTLNNDKNAIYVADVTGGINNYAFRAAGGQVFLSQDYASMTTEVNHFRSDANAYGNNTQNFRAAYIHGRNFTNNGAAQGTIEGAYIRAGSSGNVAGAAVRALRILADPGTLGSFTSAVGIEIINGTSTNTTTKYGIYIQTQSGATTNWGLYSAGANNYMGGATLTSNNHLITTGEWPARFFNFSNTSTHRANFLAVKGRTGATAVLSGDTLGGVALSGYHATGAHSLGYNGGVEINAYATESWSGTNKGADLGISVTPATTAGAERVFNIGYGPYSSPGFWGTNGTNYLLTHIATSPAFVWDGAGNLRFGTAATVGGTFSEKAALSSGGDFYARNGSTYVYLKTSGSTSGYSCDLDANDTGFYIATNSASRDIYVRPGGATAARFYNNGKLEVFGGVVATGGIANGASTNAGFTFRTPGDNDSGMFCDSDGLIKWYTNNGYRGDFSTVLQWFDEIRSSGANGFRLNYNATTNYGVILRNDASDFYILLTNLNDGNGIWNSLRPFRMSLANGSTYMDAYVSGGSTLTVTEDIYSEAHLGCLTFAMPTMIQPATTNIGVLGIKNNSGSDGTAVFGWNRDAAGTGRAIGVYGLVDSVTSGNKFGVVGEARNGGNNYGVYGYCTGGTVNYGIYNGGGTKSWANPHPEDPTKKIDYITIEGGESGTYWRGRAKLVNGEATVKLPEHFRLVTSSELEVTVTTTPRSADSKGLACVESDNAHFVVKELHGGAGSYEFDYIVMGKRLGYEEHEPIQENDLYVPNYDRNIETDKNESAWGDTQEWFDTHGEGMSRIFKMSGILLGDGKVNVETFDKHNWPIAKRIDERTWEVYQRGKTRTFQLASGKEQEI